MWWRRCASPLRNIVTICDAAEEPTQGDTQDKQAVEPEKAGEAK